LNGHRGANRAGSRDVSSEPYEVRFRHDSVGNIDSKIVDRIACASLRHEDEVPGPIVGRSRVCGTRYGNKKACCRCAKRKLFHVDFSEAANGVWVRYGNGEASQKKPFPHAVSTPREVGGLHHHGFGTWAVPVLHASTATASQHLVERRAVDRAEQIYADRHRPAAQRDPRRECPN